MRSSRQPNVLRGRPALPRDAVPRASAPFPYKPPAQLPQCAGGVVPVVGVAPLQGPDRVAQATRAQGRGDQGYHDTRTGSMCEKLQSMAALVPCHLAVAPRRPSHGARALRRDQSSRVYPAVSRSLIQAKWSTGLGDSAARRIDENGTSQRFDGPPRLVLALDEIAPERDTPPPACRCRTLVELVVEPVQQVVAVVDDIRLIAGEHRISRQRRDGG